MKKAVLNEEFKRMQKLAGVLNENTTLPEDIKKYLLGMPDEFGVNYGDDEFEPGTAMEFRYEGEDFEDEDEDDDFFTVRDYLKKKGPITLNYETTDLTYSTDGEDIIMNWIEPD